MILENYLDLAARNWNQEEVASRINQVKPLAICHVFAELADTTPLAGTDFWETVATAWRVIGGSPEMASLAREKMGNPPVYLRDGNNRAKQSKSPLSWEDLWAIATELGRVVEEYASVKILPQKHRPYCQWLPSEKKRGGVFFTPPIIARYIVERIATHLEDNLQNLSILDPSVGGGHFLLAFAQVFDKSEKHVNPAKIAPFVQNSLFGIDQDPCALAATALLFGCAAQDWGVAAAFYENNLWQGDALLMELPREFDVVVGNPPWGSVQGRERTNYKSLYSMCNDFERYEYFSVMALRAVKTQGYHAFLVPNTFLRNVSSTQFRDWYISEAQFQEIHDFSTTELFSGPKVRSCFFISKKGGNGAGTVSIWIHNDRNPSITITGHKTSTQWFRNNQDNWSLCLVPPQILESIFYHILRQSLPLGEYAESKQGFIPYRFSTLSRRFSERFSGLIEGGEIPQDLQECLGDLLPAGVNLPLFPPINVDNYQIIAGQLARHIIKEKSWHRTLTPGETIPAGYWRLLKGRAVRPFHLQWKNQLVAYGPHVSTYVEDRYFRLPRLLFPEITRPLPYCIQAAYTREAFVHDPQVLNAIFKPDIDERWHWFCLAAVNSLPVSVFMQISSPKMGKGLFDKLLVADVKRIPIPLSLDLLSDLTSTLPELQALAETDSKAIAEVIRVEVKNPNIIPARALEIAITIGISLTRLFSDANVDADSAKSIISLQDLNDRLFCHLFSVDYNICTQVAHGEYRYK